MHGTVPSTCSGWRPRSLYASVFLWISVVGGRFLVLFLEHEASLTSAQLGTILAVAQLASVGGTAVTGSWADALEFRFPGAGRALVLAGGMALGGAVFLFHGVHLPTAILGVPPVLWHGFLRILFALATAMVFPVVDGMCLEYLQKHASTQDYGKERMYGAVAWGVANVIVAVAMDYFDGFAVLYVMALIVTVIGVVVVFFYAQEQQQQLDQGQGQGQGQDPSVVAGGYRKRDSNLILEDNNADDDQLELDNEDQRTGEEDETIEHSCSSSPSANISTFQMLYLLGTSWFGLCFIIAQVTQSSGQAIVDNLVFLYFEALGSSYTLMGLTVVLTVAFEIPIFHFAPTLLERWGPGPLIPLASLSYVVRVWGYSLIPQGQAAHVLWLEPLHGVTFGFMATAGVELVSSLVSTPGYEASGQSALQVLVGTGSVVGLLLGGWLDEFLGPRWMYRISGGVVLLGCTLFTVALYRCPTRTATSNRSIIRNKESEVDAVSYTMSHTERHDESGQNNSTAVEMIRLVGTAT
jgi:MFS family permease